MGTGGPQSASLYGSYCTEKNNHIVEMATRIDLVLTGHRKDEGHNSCKDSDGRAPQHR